MKQSDVGNMLRILWRRLGKKPLPSRDKMAASSPTCEEGSASPASSLTPGRAVQRHKRFAQQLGDGGGVRVGVVLSADAVPVPVPDR